MSLSFAPLPLGRIAEPFDDPQWLFELKYDGFRALAYVQGGRCRLVSRNGNTFSSFTDLADSIAAALPHVRSAVLDGEIVCLDRQGRCQFNELLFRRGNRLFVAFDLISRGGLDCRCDPLYERKRTLRQLLPGKLAKGSPVMFADHVEAQGTALFQLACEMDLEGIVAKRRVSPYLLDGDRSPWFKIRNRHYSQWAGRSELFERERHTEPAPGWHACELACIVP